MSDILAPTGANYDVFSVDNEITITLNNGANAGVKVTFLRDAAALPLEKQYQACQKMVDELCRIWNAAPQKVNL